MSDRKYTWADGDNPEEPMNLDRARKIVGYAEDEFASGRDIDDAFAPFSEGGAATRLEAVQALYIVIADYFHSACVRDSGSPDAMKHFQRYANLSGPIALRILSDNIQDPAKVPDAMGNQETVESFVCYLKTLNAARADFWSQVNQRIGLDYPSESHLKPRKDALSSGKRAWWRFW